jgi:uncharacterized protein GlcG (DUF336 family)
MIISGLLLVVAPAAQTLADPPAQIDSATGEVALQASEVQVILGEALAVANQARAGIRRSEPNNQTVRVMITIVDSLGEVLAFAKTDDPPLFGSEVSLLRARSAAAMSSTTVAASAPTGPLREPMAEWSVFSSGVQVDVSAGAVPIYREGADGSETLIGAIGVAGDSAEQDDLTAFLGLDRASEILAKASSAPPRLSRLSSGAQR